MASPSNLRGIAAMIAAMAAFVGCDSCMKLAMAELPPFEVLAIRGIWGTIACFGLLLTSGQWRDLPKAANRWVFLRAASEGTAVLLFVTALARMPIGDLTSLMQTSPLVIVLVTAWVWREPIGGIRAALIIAGFLGAVLVAQPGAATASSMAPVALAAAVLAAGRDILTRMLPSAVPGLVASFALIVLVMAIAALASLLFEHALAPSWRVIAILALSGSLVMLGQVFVLAAYRLGAAPAIAPFSYTATIWAMLSGVVLFGDWPALAVLAGVALIVASGVALAVGSGRRLAARVA